MIPLHLLVLKNDPIFKQLQLEEALLRADDRNWCIINEGVAPAIVMGISGKPDELIVREKYLQSPVPVIRRFSGGGTVFVDEKTVFVTFIFNSSSIHLEPFPRSIMRWTESFYKPLFGTHPFSLEETDYVLGAKKFGGNAQSICKKRWLHHSSLLWDYSVANMDYLHLPKKTPDYRQGRLHSEFLCSLKKIWPSKEDLKSGLIEEVKKQFSISYVDDEELEEILARPHRKATLLLEKLFSD